MAVLSTRDSIRLTFERSSGREFRIATQGDINAFEAAAGSARKIIQLNPAAFSTEPINPIRPYKNTRGLSGPRQGHSSVAAL